MGKITVTAEGIDRNRGGSVIFFLYAEEGFPKDHSKALERKTLKAGQENITIEFEHVPARFAIKILHDEDENGQVTKNWTGIIPREGLGFSNGQKLGLSGPPKFKHCVLELNAVSLPIAIKLEYP